MQHPAASCVTDFVVHRGGGVLSSCSVWSTRRSSFYGCFRFRIMRSLFFLVQLGPVLGTGISRKLRIIRKEYFDFQTGEYI